MSFGGLTEEEIDHIADRAAERALERVYSNIGKSVVKKLMWIVGAASLTIVVWLGGGHIPKG